MEALKTVQVQGRASKTRYLVPDDWEPLRHLGSGAYAAVHAFKASDGTEFAVKKVERVFDHPVLALRTLRELRLLAHFRHPNVLGLQKVYFEGPSFQDVYMALDMMDGDLHQLIYATKEKLTDYQVQCVLYQLGRGLLCLRKAHVIHRDLKPGNILVKGCGAVKIADLGLARSIDADEENEQLKCVLTEYVVTRYYRAPEVVLTATHYTYAVDIWSTGCILGEMITKQPLFEGKDSLDQIKKIVKVIGAPSPEDMSWIPRSSASWKFVEQMKKQIEKQTGGQAVQCQWDQLLPGANPLATELLAQMLRFDPSRRISVEQTLVHRYLAAFDACQDPEVAVARAVPPVDWSFDRALCFDEENKSKPFNEHDFREAFLATQLAAEQPTPRLKDRKPTQGLNASNAGSDVFREQPRERPREPTAVDAAATGVAAGVVGSDEADSELVRSPERRKPKTERPGRWSSGGAASGYSAAAGVAPPLATRGAARAPMPVPGQVENYHQPR